MSGGGRIAPDSLRTVDSPPSTPEMAKDSEKTYSFKREALNLPALVKNVPCVVVVEAHRDPLNAGVRNLPAQLVTPDGGARRRRDRGEAMADGGQAVELALAYHQVLGPGEFTHWEQPGGPAAE